MPSRCQRRSECTGHKFDGTCRVESTAAPLSCRAGTKSERAALAGTSRGRSSLELQGWRASRSEPSTPPARCISLSDHLLCEPGAGGRRGAAQMKPRASGAVEDQEDHVGDDCDFPSEILIYPATDDEGEPQVKAAWELWLTPAPKRGRDRAPAAEPRRGVLGARPHEAAPVAAPPRSLGIHTIQDAPVAVRAERDASRMLQAGKSAAKRRVEPRVTTLSVRNVPVSTSQRAFLDEVNRSGFAGRYDFAYVPRDFKSCLGKGHAFLNFTTPEAAVAFAGSWHKSRRFGATVNVSRAALQGLWANLSRWSPGRVSRVKDAEFLPFAFSGPFHGAGPWASAAEPHDRR